ncbi:hypothetical protein Tco_0168289 [Tanacetum coccineum]
MTRVPRHAAEHRLNVREGCLPIRQKKKGQAPKRNKANQEEVEILVDAGIMKEVHYHSWLSNPVMAEASIKGQILADFIVERPEEESTDVPITEPEEIPEPWTLFTGGSSCIDGSGAD